MKNNISVVINTLNESNTIKRAITSVKWADEIIVCDMYSTDQTAKIAKDLGAKIIFHKKIDYVEPARNFAISKVSNEWILILDPDEEISEKLKDQLIKISLGKESIDYFRIPRKNIIFGKWMQNAMWWPDYNIRFFKKGKAQWGGMIHRPPETIGEGLDLPKDENMAIVHHHYETIDQFIERMLRYTKIQAEELQKDGYAFKWEDLITKPVGEFLSRFFSNRGFEDGLHGLILSLLQSFSFFVMYIRLWEMSGHRAQVLELSELKNITVKINKDTDYWFQYIRLSKNPINRLIQKVKNKL